MRKPSNDIISGLDFAGLPTPPAILIELIDTCNSSEVTIARLAKIIHQDAGVSSKVITAANSPVYRQFNEINDINRLLVVLGLKTVKTIAVTGAVQQFFSQVDHPVERILGEIWYHSLSCAYIAKALAELTGYATPDEAYLAGLLHRLGQLALLQAYPKEYAEIFDRGLYDEALANAERKQLNISSCEVGAQLIDSWKVRSFIADAVRYQFAAAEAIHDASHLVKLINLSSRLCTYADKPDGVALERADLLFGLNQSLIEEMMQAARGKVKAAAQSFGIQLPSPSGRQEQGLSVDASLRLALGERVKGLALIGSGVAEPAHAPDLHKTLKRIQRDIGLLFGLSSSCFLLHDDETGLLQAMGLNDETATLLSAIRISTRTERSLAARAFNSRSLTDSFASTETEPLSVVDRQLSRLLGKEGLIYLPLLTQNLRLGLIAAGVDAAKWKGLQGQTDLLKLFAHEASNTLLRQRSQAAAEAQRLADEHSQFQLEARKVIHEANNPLGIINVYLNILGMKLGDEHPVQDEINIIQEEIERVGKIILRIRDIPEELEQNSPRVDVNKLITDLYKLFESSLFTTHRIEASLQLDENLPPVVSNRSHLKQILTNLIKNAVEAMEPSGRLAISTQDKVHLNGVTCIEILIVDNGPGIPDEIMNNIFSPVISTKDSSHSGLGLAIVKNLVDELSGSISCTSNPESGTRFQLFLPRVTQDAPKAEYMI